MKPIQFTCSKARKARRQIRSAAVSNTRQGSGEKALTSFNGEHEQAHTPPHTLRDIQQAAALTFRLAVLDRILTQLLDVRIGGVGNLPQEVRCDADVDEEVYVEEDGIGGDEGLLACAGANEAALGVFSVSI